MLEIERERNKERGGRGCEKKRKAVREKKILSFFHIKWILNEENKASTKDNIKAL